MANTTASLVHSATANWHLRSKNWTALNFTGWLCLLALLCFIFKLVVPVKQRKGSDSAALPTVSSNTLPRFILNLEFARSATRILEIGYKRFQDQAFHVLRGDTDLVVLPVSLLEELSRLPSSIASPHGALEQDLLGAYTGLDLILDSRIHHSIVQRKLTPRLNLLTPHLEEELKTAMDEFFPTASDWTKFQPYQALAKVAARLASRALVGETLCRDPAWLDIAVNYTENLFRTIVLLRLFPGWAHRFLCPMLPSYWRGQQHIKNAKILLRSTLSELLQKNDAGEWTPGDGQEESTVMHWLADTAKGRDRNADTLAHILVLLALASVHTTLLRMINVLYDLIAHPKYIDELRAEIVDVYTNQHESWPPTSYDQLHKLDSVLRESQRISPPTTVGLKRVFKEEYVFENGLRVAAGTYVCMPSFAIENDPRITPNPEIWDGLRSYRLFKQHEQPQDAEELGQKRVKHDQFSFASFDATTLNFGYGKHACPGRFFASLILKMLFVRLLSEYDFKFLPGSARPSNYTLHEFLFCWPWQKILIKGRDHGLESPCPF